MNCLHNSGIASTNEEAATWVINAASRVGGRALLYAGMICASGAGVPQDMKQARRLLEKARDMHVSQAGETLQVLDKAIQEVK
jgi:TPR repeat protein